MLYKQSHDHIPLLTVIEKAESVDKRQGLRSSVIQIGRVSECYYSSSGIDIRSLKALLFRKVRSVVLLMCSQ